MVKDLFDLCIFLSTSLTFHLTFKLCFLVYKMKSYCLLTKVMGINCCQAHVSTN